MLESFLQYSGLLTFLLLLVVGYTAGSLSEKIHFRSLAKREKENLGIVVVTMEEGVVHPNGNCQLVMGSVVISIDYFKRLVALLKNIIGGRVSSYETLVERARREALLRMKEEAVTQGFNYIVNVRLETAAIGMRANQKGQIGSVDTIAYGTAIKLEPR